MSRSGKPSVLTSLACFLSLSITAPRPSSVGIEGYRDTTPMVTIIVFGGTLRFGNVLSKDDFTAAVFGM